MPQSQPNILLIMSDQHNPRVLGAYGDPIVRTPNMDRLAQQGVLFEHTYCGNPLCVPSRMTFLSSRHSHEIEVWSNGDFLRSDYPTYNHSLSLAGYDTPLCGRMHILGPDQHHAYSDLLVGHLYYEYGGHDPKITGHLPLATAGNAEVACQLAGPAQTTYQMYDEAVIDGAVEFLQDRSQQERQDPFCLTVSYVLPHCPYNCPQDLFDYYMERVDVPALPAHYLDRLHPAVKEYREKRGMNAPTPEEMHRALAAYYGLVELSDRNLGRILQALEHSPFRDNTVVMYTSDHGDMAGEHHMWMKTCFYDGSVTVPLIITGPGIRKGARVTRNASLLDIGPTAIELGGGEPLPDVAGRSLVPFLTSALPVESWPDTVFAECSSTGFSRMVKKGPWKLNVFEGHERPQLFNLEDDPAEMNDLGESPEHQALIGELKAEVFRDWSPGRCRQVSARNARATSMVRQWAKHAGKDQTRFWEKLWELVEAGL